MHAGEEGRRAVTQQHLRGSLISFFEEAGFLQHLGLSGNCMTGHGCRQVIMCSLEQLGLTVVWCPSGKDEVWLGLTSSRTFTPGESEGQTLHFGLCMPV